MEDFVKIKVVDMSGNEAKFEMLKTLPLSHLMSEYASVVNARRDVLRFLYEGRRLGDNDLLDIFMDDEDEWKIIELFLEQC